MQPTYTFNVDTDRHLVHIVMSGFFTPDDINRFREARNQAHLHLRCEPNQHLTLVDICRMQIQSQDAVACFSRIFQETRYASRAIAIVVSQSLSRMQVQRAASGRDVRYFMNDAAAARQWLLDGGSCATGNDQTQAA